jgi:hypothetical protein
VRRPGPEARARAGRSLIAGPRSRYACPTSWPSMLGCRMVERCAASSTSWESVTCASHRLVPPSPARWFGSGNGSGTSSRPHSLTGEDTVSKTEGRRFEPCRPCPVTKLFVTQPSSFQIILGLQRGWSGVDMSCLIRPPEPSVTPTVTPHVLIWRSIAFATSQGTYPPANAWHRLMATITSRRQRAGRPGPN